MTNTTRTAGQTIWRWGTNNGTPVFVKREGPRRWSVWTKGVDLEAGGDRWGHFRTMRDAGAFARAVGDGRAFTANVGLRMIVDPAHGGRRR